MTHGKRFSWKVTMFGFALAAAATSAQAADLNAFFPERGEGTVALSYTTESYDQFWRGTTKTMNAGVGEVDTRSTSLWLRYGLSHRLALVADAAYVDVTSDGTGGFADHGFQDISVLATYRLWQGNSDHGVRHVLAGAIGLRTPLGDYVANAPVSLGDGSTDGLFRMVYQIETGGFYASQQVGFDLRGQDPPNGFPLYTELGYTVGRLTVGGFYSRYFADGGTDIADPGFTFPSNREESERAGARLYLKLDGGFGIGISGFATLDGRNTGDSRGLSLSLVYQL